MTKQKTQPTTGNEDLANIDPTIIKAIRDQVISELSDKEQREKEALRIKKEQENKTRQKYVSEMRESAEPWMEIIGMSEENGKISIELDWNPPFVTLLKQSGYTGPDDESVVQRYIAILAKQIADDMEKEDGGQ